jgi:hypothetical protein
LDEVIRLDKDTETKDGDETSGDTGDFDDKDVDCAGNWTLLVGFN